MIDTKTIKDRILSFAFQGRLVKVKPSKISNDNLEAIHSQVKGYIPVSEEEYLINAPKEWSWTRLGYITCNHGQKTPSDTFSYIDVGTLDNVNHRLSSTENIVEAKDAPSRAKKVVVKGDVIYSTVRPYLHNICIIDKDFSYTPIASTAFCVMQANETVLYNRYLFYWLLTKEFDKYSNGDPSKGALYPAIGEKDLLRGTIPLPSIAEQEEIVDKIEAVFEILDKIDALQNQYVSNQEALKNKLIDAGITGRLTEPLPGDGSVSELHTSILRDKKRILNERNGRADKNIKEIDDNVPFDIPEHWKWIRFGDVGLFKKGPFGSALTKSMFVPKNKDTVKVYEQQHAIRKDANIGTYYITKKYFDEKMSGFEVQSGDIIVSCAGTIGETYILPEDIERGIINQALMRITLAEGIDRRFFLYYFDSNLKKSAQEESNGSAIKNIPPFDVMKNWYFPLPPIEEQGRIADKIDELLQYC